MNAVRALAVGIGLAALLIGGRAASTEAGAATPPCRWVGASGIDPRIAPDKASLDASPTRHRQLRLFRELMDKPLSAPCRANLLLEGASSRLHSPPALLHWLAVMTGFEAVQPRPTTPPSSELKSDAIDPLAAALSWMTPFAENAHLPWPPALPDRAKLPDPLRAELSAMIVSIGQAHALLRRALARMPASIDTEMLRSQLTRPGDAPVGGEGRMLPQLLPLLDRAALVAGMVELTAATERLHQFLSVTSALPAISWSLSTPLGVIIVDTTGDNNVRRLTKPLLVLDVGGDDQYEFTAAPAARHIAVVLDHGGNDRYVANVDGADPSGAALGYGILWDSNGNDLYQGRHFAQAAALFGAALLIDSAGINRFVAAGHAQGYAFGGIALLLSSPANDEFTAQTHAQASAGPEAVAVLIDRGGDDRYTLDNTPLLLPSPQLPTHNTSMGQGAGRGLRARSTDGLSATGGIGVLIDLAGNDRYTAQVFTQGAGYYEGLGMLIDASGADRFEAAWYAMGAAAHQAAGVVLKSGTGNDRYVATHSTSLGAAHDLSIAAFLDEGGDDDYALGDLGFGASHDDGVAAFVDLAGRDRYTVALPACRAFGVVERGEPPQAGTRPSAAGVFIDAERAGDHLSEACPHPSVRLTRDGPGSPMP